MMRSLSMEAMLAMIIGARIVGMVVGGVVFAEVGYHATLCVKKLRCSYWLISLLAFIGWLMPFILQEFAQWLSGGLLRVSLSGKYPIIQYSLFCLGFIIGAIVGLKDVRACEEALAASRQPGDNANM